MEVLFLFCGCHAGGVSFWMKVRKSSQNAVNLEPFGRQTPHIPISYGLNTYQLWDDLCKTNKQIDSLKRCHELVFFPAFPATNGGCWLQTKQGAAPTSYTWGYTSPISTPVTCLFSAIYGGYNSTCTIIFKKTWWRFDKSNCPFLWGVYTIRRQHS